MKGIYNLRLTTKIFFSSLEKYLMVPSVVSKDNALKVYRLLDGKDNNERLGPCFGLYLLALQGTDTQLVSLIESQVPFELLSPLQRYFLRAQLDRTNQTGPIIIEQNLNNELNLSKLSDWDFFHYFYCGSQWPQTSKLLQKADFGSCLVAFLKERNINLAVEILENMKFYGDIISEEAIFDLERYIAVNLDALEPRNWNKLLSFAVRNNRMFRLKFFMKLELGLKEAGISDLEANLLAFHMSKLRNLDYEWFVSKIEPILREQSNEAVLSARVNLLKFYYQAEQHNKLTEASLIDRSKEKIDNYLVIISILSLLKQRNFNVKGLISLLEPSSLHPYLTDLLYSLVMLKSTGFTKETFDDLFLEVVKPLVEKIDRIEGDFEAIRAFLPVLTNKFDSYLIN